jgi:hypothetical protein
MTHISLWPILVASVAAFAIGAAWYSPLFFGKEWMRLKGISEKDITDESKKGMWKLYLAQLISTIAMFLVLGFFVSATGSTGAANGAFLAFLAWVGFSLTTAVGDMLWNKTPVKLVLITEVGALITWALGGAIIGAWS